MADTEKIKYFLTSDEKFLIDINKISLITFTGYEAELFIDDTGKTPTLDYNNIYKSSKDILSSYYNVYIDGVKSPVQLKYTDGVMLMNIINTQEKVLFNSIYDGNPENLGTKKLNDINYTLDKYIIPYKLRSNITTIDNLKYSTRITIKNT